jgi:hypothetical protein
MKISLTYFIVLFFLSNNIISQNSILEKGDWFKIGVLESGVFKIDKNFLEKNNISTNGLDPKKIQVYGSGYNGALPQLNSKSNKINPQEIQIRFSGNSNDIFEENEFIYFYLQSSDKIYFDIESNRIKTEKNIYTDTAYYFVKIDGDKSRVINLEESTTNFEDEINNVFFNYRYENDLYNIIQSGRYWYGEIFSPGNSLSIPLNEFFVENSNVSLELGLVSRSTVPSSFTVSIDNSELSTFEMNTIKEGIYGNKILSQVEMMDFNYPPNGGYINLKYSGTNSAISYLDYVDVTGIIELNSYSSSNLLFYSLAENKRLFRKYNISSNKYHGIDENGKNNLKFWNISDSYNIYELETIYENDNYYVIKNDSLYSRNIVFDIKNIIYPIFSKKVENSNILNGISPDLLIITHNDFFKEAKRIKTLREEEGLLVSVTNIKDIFNQFSSGNQDVSSIRNYIKYIYNTSSKKLKYVLLFGDCSYDYKDRIPNNTNFIPIYQSYNSFNNIYSFSSDDYFGFLENNEGIWIENLNGDHDLEVSIGRIPSNNISDSKDYVDKLYTYSKKNQVIGDWKKNIFLIADDGDNNVHQNDAENHFNLLNEQNPEYNIRKIYLDNYRQEVINGVKLSNQTKYKLDDAIDKGSMIVNYIGHGNEFFWTEEKILDDNSIYNWNNRSKLPLFITATCEFGKFDDPLITSGGELLLNKGNGGAIALLTTTRPVFSQTNFRLNNQFYKNVFSKIDDDFRRLGDIFVDTKNNSLSGPINRNFALLGDPSLKLIYPKYSISIEKIDTLKSGGKIVISGDIVDSNNDKIETFNGEIFSEVFDKISTKLTLGDESDPYSFNEWDDVIFKGNSSIINGSFSFEFTVPVNIEYNFDKGKINLFATDTISFQEAIGYSEFIIGGTSNEFKSDNTGPDLNIYIDDLDFQSGDIVSKSPLLIVKAYDDNGINLTNMNSYQKMIGIIDDTMTVILNDYFSYNKNDFQEGFIRYPLGELGNGKHKIEIKITDNYNNLSSNSVVFIIGEDNRLNIKNVMNFPNPFSDFTTFKFDLPQDDPSVYVILDVYDLRGNKVFEYQKTYEFPSSVIDDIYWNGNDLNNYPLPQGMYIYKLHVSNLSNDKKVTVHNKVFKKL